MDDGPVGGTAARILPPTVRLRLGDAEIVQRLQGGGGAQSWRIEDGRVAYEIATDKAQFIVAREAIAIAAPADLLLDERPLLTIRAVEYDGAGDEPPIAKLSFYGTSEEPLGEHRVALTALAGPRALIVPEGAETFMIRVRLAGGGWIAGVRIVATVDRPAATVIAPAEPEDAPAIATESAFWDDFAVDRSLPGRVERLAWADFEVRAEGWIADDPGARSAEVELWIDGVRMAREVALGPVSIVATDGEDRSIRPFVLRALATRDGLAQRMRVRVPHLDRDLAVAPLDESVPDHRSGGIESVRPGDVVLGGVNAVGRTALRGWAIDAERPDAAPDLLLALDGVAFALTRPRMRRADVAKRFASHGQHGFRFELPANLGILDGFEAEVSVVAGIGEIERAATIVPPRLADALRSVLPAPDRAYRPHMRRAIEAKLSCIVLNLDGAELLRDLFASAAEHASAGVAEWIVVDHASTDGSEEVCQEWRRRGLPIRFVPRPANFSFGESNNHGAAQASGDILVFINNDILLTEDIWSRIADALADDAIGLVGIKLLDAPPPGREAPTPVQHLGVYLDPVLEAGGFRPFEARPAPEIAETEDATAVVPAATGALFAMRAADFVALGGFDEGYHYGLEDVDLCLRVQRRLGKQVLSLNGVSAIHRRAVTRVEATKADPRRAANARVFNTRWAGELRQITKRDLLGRPGFWNGHRPVLAIAIDTGDDEARAAAVALAARLQGTLPIHVTILDAEGWRDLQEIDVLVSVSARLDLSEARVARPHLATIAWTRGGVERWTAIHGYDHVWDELPDDPGAWLRDRAIPVRIAIKSPAPSGDAGRHWGDTHFAESLAHALRGQGFVVRIDPRERWDDAIGSADDIAIVLRGRQAFTPLPHQRSILWLISHPHEVMPGAFEAYDHVYVASEAYARTLAGLVSVPVECLHQCTDARLFRPDADLRHVPRADTLFVGNSRGVFRESVRWAVEGEEDVSVYGEGWGNFVSDAILKGAFVPNAMLGRLYAASRNVLCDHWPDMKKLGFVSNRVFDVLAAGGHLVVDAVAGLEAVIGDRASVYRDRAGLLAALAQGRAKTADETRAAAEWTLAHHSFDARAAVIAQRIARLLAIS